MSESERASEKEKVDCCSMDKCILGILNTSGIWIWWEGGVVRLAGISLSYYVSSCVYGDCLTEKNPGCRFCIDMASLHCESAYA